MGSAVNSILLFSGLWAFALCASRQFYVVETEMNWTEAQKWCRENYTDLATIENEEEMNAVKDLLKNKSDSFWGRNNGNGNNIKGNNGNGNNGNGNNGHGNNGNERRVWIGLEETTTSGNKSWFWSDGTPFNYTNWSSGEPNFGNNGPFCVELYRGNNTWNDAGCHNHKNNFICYKNRTPLIVINETKSWRDALRFCRQNHEDLVSVDSEEMQAWVEVVTKHVSTDVWIGLRHTCTLGFWYWVTGNVICYQNWAPGNGTGVEDCGGVERTGAVLSESKKWVSLPETHQLYFICSTT